MPPRIRSSVTIIRRRKMKISGGELISRAMLASAAAIVAAAETMTAAQAADAGLKKAPPIQYVKTCSIYGNGFFQLPGTVFCAAFRGQLQIDTNFEHQKDL